LNIGKLEGVEIEAIAIALIGQAIFHIGSLDGFPVRRQNFRIEILLPKLDINGNPTFIRFKI
jgi:hypothetical protein